MMYIEQTEDEKIRKNARESKRAHFDKGGSSFTKVPEARSKREKPLSYL